MTLARQLIIAVVVLFVLLFAGNMVVSLFNARTLVDEQMAVHAQDTATSVGISMTQAAQDNDIAALDVLFNAVSDSGFYQRIYFSDLDDKVVIDRSFAVAIEGVPDWFVTLMDLNAREGRAEVNSGWTRLGQVVVVSHPGKAYGELWRVTLQQLSWFSAITLLVCLLAYFALRWLLKPLEKVEQQADAICRQDFVIQDTVPKTRELNRVVTAMNRMSQRLSEIFDSQLDLIGRLQVMAYRDPVTGLSNRADFDARLKAMASDVFNRPSCGLMLFALSDLKDLNQLAGREAGNNLLKGFGKLLEAEIATFGKALVARRQGLEFAVLIENLSENDAAKVAEKLFEKCLDYLNTQPSATELTIHMGFTHQSEVTEGISLLKEADSALKRSLLNDQSIWSNYNEIEPVEDEPVAQKSLEEWQQLISRALYSGSIKTFSQPILKVGNDNLLSREVFTRFNEGEQELSAGIVLPYAERLDLAEQFDQQVLNHLAAKFSGRQPVSLSVNLSAKAVSSQGFHRWLRTFLGSHVNLANSLIFEVAEYIIHQNETMVRSLQQVIVPFGCQLAIDNFGLEASAFSYLRSLPVAYIKVHRSFISGVDANPDNQFYVKSLLQLAQSKEIPLVAEGVETAEELESLKALGVEYVQGFYLGRPEPVQ